MSVSAVVTVSGIEAGEAALTYWPGALNVIDGAWLSESTVTTGEGAELPAASVEVARSSYEPSPSELVFHGEVMTLHVDPASCDDSRTTPGDASWLSVALAVTVTEPETVAPPVGAVIETLGFVRSTNQVYEAALPVFPARSVARAWKVWLPSASVASVSGVEHGANEPAPSSHSKRADSAVPNWTVGVPTLPGWPGSMSIELAGAVVAT